MSLLRRDHRHGSGAAAATGATPHRLWTQRARKEGRELVTMHCFTAEHGFLVLCDVFPANGADGRRVQAGPYVFSTQREADEFAEEASVVLAHLGCELSLA
jgi:hypothetical protein